jgi:hypothetical protein
MCYEKNVEILRNFDAFALIQHPVLTNKRVLLQKIK